MRDQDPPSRSSGQSEVLKQPCIYSVQVIEKCIADIRAWIRAWKTEFLIICSRGQFSKININSITVGDSSIEPVKSIRNLGLWFDEHMVMVLTLGTSAASSNLDSSFLLRLLKF